MDNLAFQGLSYHLLRAKPAFHSQSLALHNRSFEFWKTQWTRELAKINPGDKLNLDDFLRQDFMSVIQHRSDVVALHFYSLFDLQQDAARAHSYFGNSYSDKAMAQMKDHSARTAMSFEYFTVAPQWRGAAAGFSLAATLLDLGLKLFGQLGADIALGICRVDVGVARLCYAAGGIALDSNRMIHGVECDLVGILQGAQKPYKGETENQLAEMLWNSRVDHTNETQSLAPRKAA